MTAPQKSAPPPVPALRFPFSLELIIALCPGMFAVWEIIDGPGEEAIWFWSTKAGAMTLCSVLYVLSILQRRGGPRCARWEFRASMEYVRLACSISRSQNVNCELTIDAAGWHRLDVCVLPVWQRHKRHQVLHGTHTIGTPTVLLLLERPGRTRRPVEFLSLQTRPQRIEMIVRRGGPPAFCGAAPLRQ